MSKIILQNDQVIDLNFEDLKDLRTVKKVYILYVNSSINFPLDIKLCDDGYKVSMFCNNKGKHFNFNHPIQSIEVEAQDYYFYNNCTEFKNDQPKLNVKICKKGKFINDPKSSKSIKYIDTLTMDKGTQFEFNVTRKTNYKIISPKDNLVIKNISYIHKICAFLNKKFDKEGNKITNIELKEFHAFREFDKLTNDDKSILSTFGINSIAISRYNEDNFLKNYSISNNSLEGSAFKDLSWEMFVLIGQHIEGQINI